MNAARRFPERIQRSVFDRIKGGTVNTVCAYWLAGRCTRNPCRFFHPASLPSQPPKQSTYQHPKAWRRSPEDGVKKSSISPSGVPAKKRCSSSSSDCERNSPSGLASKKLSSISSSNTEDKAPEDHAKNSSVSPSGLASEKMSSISSSNTEHKAPKDIAKNSSVSPSGVTGVAALQMSSISPSGVPAKKRCSSSSSDCERNSPSGLASKKLSSISSSNTEDKAPKDHAKNSSVSPSGLASEKMSSISSSNTEHKAPKDIAKNSSVSPSGVTGVAAIQMSSISPSDCDDKSASTTPDKVCKHWLLGNCVQGEKCKNLHSWFCGSGFSMLAKLEGHNKAVNGIALPSGSTKLYSSGKDNTLRVWDGHTGQCLHVANLSGEVGSLISEGPWVFIGLSNSVKVWNSQTQTELTLDGPVGQVYAMVEGNDVLFAGTQDGTILAWKPSSETFGLDLAAALKGHSSAVISLCVGAKRLYSGSMDNTIRVWDLNTFECLQTLKGHTDAVMSVLCWEIYLLSCSLDGTIKVWTATESGNIEVIHTRKEEHGCLVLCGIEDAEAKPILLCSCNDNIVRLYDLPSFTERGRIFAKQEVQTIQIGPDGLFFTGDATGQLTVWKLAGEPITVAS